MTADTAARKDEQPARAWTVFPRRCPFSRVNAPCPPNRRGGRGYALITWNSHGIRTAVWTLRQEKRPGNPAGFRLPSRHGQSMTPTFGSSRSPSLILSRENRRTRVLTTAMDVVGTAESGGLCPPSSRFFDREQSPYGIVLTSKNKRDRNKTMTGKARIFRVFAAFTGLFPEKSAGNGFPCQRAYCAHWPERFHVLIKEQFYVPYQYDRNGEHLPFLDCPA